jgi:hypothetical protein
MTLAQGEPVGDAGALHASKRRASLIAAAVLVLWFAFFALAGPYACWRLEVPSVLLFFPQYMFPFFGAMRRNNSGGTAVFSTAAQYGLSAGLWGTVAVAFVFFAHGRRVRTLLWLAPVVILVVTLVVNVALGVAGGRARPTLIVR